MFVLFLLLFPVKFSHLVDEYLRPEKKLFLRLPDQPYIFSSIIIQDTKILRNECTSSYVQKRNLKG